MIIDLDFPFSLIFHFPIFTFHFPKGYLLAGYEHEIAIRK